MSRLPYSVMTNDMKRCFVCGDRRWIEIHHVFGGSNRDNSTKYGLVVPLCHYCHNEPPDGVHMNKVRREALQRVAQKKFEETHSREEFMEIFGRNYL